MFDERSNFEASETSLSDAAATPLPEAAVTVRPDSLHPVPSHPIATVRSLEEFFSMVETSWVLAIAVVLAAWIGTKLLANRVRPELERRLLRPTTANLAIGTVRVAVILLALVPVAGLLGFRPGNILLSFTVVSAVIAVLLAPVARSYISGLFVVTDRPYEVGDVVDLIDEGERAYVTDITLGYTKLRTFDNGFLVIPNEAMRERDVKNLSAEDQRLRHSLDVLVTYEGDLDAACDLLEDAARDVDDVLGGGPRIPVARSRFPAAPTALVREFADHGVVVDLRYWIDRPARLPAVRSAVLRNVFDAFADADVDFAYPHTHHVFDDTSGRARVAVDDGTGPAPVDVEEAGLRTERVASGGGRTDDRRWTEGG